MRFHRPERVRYEKNPLIEVVCEVRFPIQLAIQQSLPVDFQSALSADYPFLEMKTEVQLEFHIAPQQSEPPPGNPPAMSQVKKMVYEFLSVDKQWRISLSDQWLRFSTLKYDSWEIFENRLIVILKTLFANYQIEYFTRLGLRYRDLIDRKVLGCEADPWENLIKPEILGALRVYNAPEGDCEGFQQSLRLKLDKGNVGITHALVRHIEGHSAYLIDADFFIEETFKAETNHVASILRDFNVQAGGLFRSTISDRLHELLEPTILTS